MPAIEEVEACSLESIYELAADARDDGVRVKHRPEEQWFRCGDNGMVCLWEPQNRNGTKRISHWWVREEKRGEGVGAALLDRAIKCAKQSDADRLDIYVYETQPVENRGFEPADGGQAQDDAKYYELPLAEATE